MQNATTYRIFATPVLKRSVHRPLTTFTGTIWRKKPIRVCGEFTCKKKLWDDRDSQSQVVSTFRLAYYRAFPFQSAEYLIALIVHTTRCVYNTSETNIQVSSTQCSMRCKCKYEDSTRENEVLLRSYYRFNPSIIPPTSP